MNPTCDLSTYVDGRFTLEVRNSRSAVWGAGGYRETRQAMLGVVCTQSSMGGPRDRAIFMCHVDTGGDERNAEPPLSKAGLTTPSALLLRSLFLLCPLI